MQLLLSTTRRCCSCCQDPKNDWHNAGQVLELVALCRIHIMLIALVALSSTPTGQCERSRLDGKADLNLASADGGTPLFVAIQARGSCSLRWFQTELVGFHGGVHSLNSALSDKIGRSWTKMTRSIQSACYHSLHDWKTTPGFGEETLFLFFFSACSMVTFTIFLYTYYILTLHIFFCMMRLVTMISWNDCWTTGGPNQIMSIH